jgi:hypothetical protein
MERRWFEWGSPAWPCPTRSARQPPTLGWIFCHVLQEYARHLGDLDVVIELAGGSLGE